MIHQTEGQHSIPGRGAGTTSLWLGALAVVFALPPTIIFFAVPGYWLESFELTAYLSPFFAVLSLAAGYRARRAPRARAGITMGLVALALFAAWLLRGLYLFATAVRDTGGWW